MAGPVAGQPRVNTRRGRLAHRQPARPTVSAAVSDVFARYRLRLCTGTGNEAARGSDAPPTARRQRDGSSRPSKPVPCAAAEILILAVHEEALVKACESLEGCFAEPTSAPDTQSEFPGSRRTRRPGRCRRSRLLREDVVQEERLGPDPEHGEEAASRVNDSSFESTTWSDHRDALVALGRRD